MRKLFAVFGFFLILLLFGYFYLPSEDMNSLYQKIPDQVRENSQLITAYYSSKTGFGGFREYQFAVYNPEEKKISIYTFRISKLLKIWPRMKENKITCKTQLNYLVLATSPKKLKNFKNCDNCQLLLYQGQIYRNEEIESIYSSIEDVIQSEENVTYLELAIIKSSELSLGALELLSGDTVIYSDPPEYTGFIYLPSTMNDPKKGIILKVTPIDNQTAERTIYYPGGIKISDTIKFTYHSNETWIPRVVPLDYMTQQLESKTIKKELKESIRFTVSIFKYDGKFEVFSDWINTRRKVHAYWRVYPAGRIERIHYNNIIGHHCG